MLNSVSDFYDSLAPHYDLMTGFEKRFERERPFIRLLVEHYQIKTALDAGCGTGFHSVLLAQLGVQVTAVDASSEMVRLTIEHAKELNLSLSTVQSSFEELSTLLSGKFDAVFVMGNSLAHLMEESNLEKSFANFARLLEPEGILFAQNLNYDRILAQRDQILNSTEAGGTTFVRFYEFDDDKFVFNIKMEPKGGAEIVQRIRLNPIRRDRLKSLLGEAGFADLRLFGGISMEPYDPMTSKDLVVLARKGQITEN